MKANRLLSELLLLQSRGRVTTREVAARMEVSERTAHRDMEALSSAGVPLMAFRGASGGWELDKHWRTQVPGLDEEELRAIVLPQPTAAAERAFSKLIAAMPPALQSKAVSVRERMHVDASGWRAWSEDVSSLPVAQEAVFGEHRLAFHYRSAEGGIRARTVDPLGLVLKQNTWYLVARREKQIRTYRVSRISSAVVLAEQFKRPGRFDLAAWWKRSTAEVARHRGQFAALLTLSEEAAREFARWGEIAPLDDDPANAVGNAGRTYRVCFDSMDQAVFVTLGLGSSVVVLEPASLAERVREESAVVAARLRTSSESLSVAARYRASRR